MKAIIEKPLMVESGGGRAPSWTSGVDGHGTVLALSWLPWPLDEIKSRRDGPRTGNRHFILKIYFKAAPVEIL